MTTVATLHHNHFHDATSSALLDSMNIMPSSKVYTHCGLVFNPDSFTDPTLHDTYLHATLQRIDQLANQDVDMTVSIHVS